jgi:hypothetical protein
MQTQPLAPTIQVGDWKWNADPRWGDPALFFRDAEIACGSLTSALLRQFARDLAGLAAAVAQTERGSHVRAGD